MRPLLSTFIFLLFPLIAFSANEIDYSEINKNLNLSSDSYWLKLLHYQKNHQSETRTKKFFITEEGFKNPDAELNAFITLIMQADPLLGDQHPACLFPARYNWLQSKISTLKNIKCPALEQWKTAINASQATLVFTADYLNSPASMFGHTFLRVDSSQYSSDARLLSYAINFAANVDNPNALAFAIKGLTGAYPGVFSLLPYYEKVKEYSDMESRDLWEYELSFTAIEVDTMLNHIWELKDVEFPYYFLTHNCSYQLLSLFEIARPSLKLTQQFPLQAIPLDTLKASLATPNLLKNITFRPSLEKKLITNIDSLSPQEKKLALNLIHKKTSFELSNAEKAKALEVAYDYLYYRDIFSPEKIDKTYFRNLLIKRASIPIPDQRKIVTKPITDPNQSHETARISLSVGHDSEWYNKLQVRAAYHDTLDIAQGYRNGANLEVLKSTLRYSDNTLTLDSINLLKITSLSPRNDFLKPKSWDIDIAWQHERINQHYDYAELKAMPVVTGGIGYAWQLPNNSLCYSLLHGQGKLSPALNKGWQIGAGIKTGCIKQMPKGRLQFETIPVALNHDSSSWDVKTSLIGQWDINIRQALRLQINARNNNQDHLYEEELAWLYYF